MRVIYIVTGLYLLLPMVGLYTITPRELNAYSLSIESVYELRRAYPVFLLVFASAWALGSLFIGRRANLAPNMLTMRTYRRHRRIITLVLSVCFCLAFVTSGYAIYFQGAHRGDIRVSFGSFGFLYKTIMQFIVPATLAYAAALFVLARNNNLTVRFPLFHMVLTMMILSMMGYKSIIIVGIIPFLVVISSKISTARQILGAAGLLVILVIYSSFIIGGKDFMGSLQYLMQRGTAGMAWGLVAAWELFPEANPKAALSLLPVLGSRITASLLGISPGSPEYVMLGAGKFVTYMVHPRPDLVLSGNTNLTITIAGEATYLLGHRYFAFVAAVVGLVTGIFIGMLRKSLARAAPIPSVIIVIFICNIILPILNSGGVVGLFSLFNIVYMGATMMFLSLVFRIPNSGQQPNAALVFKVAQSH